MGIIIYSLASPSQALVFAPGIKLLLSDQPHGPVLRRYLLLNSSYFVAVRVNYQVQYTVTWPNRLK